MLIQVLKVVIPRASAPRLLHLLLRWGLECFVQPQANWLILRHFHIGSELTAFIRVNSGCAGIPADPLTPRDLAAIRDDLFLRHDLNLYNFIIDLNTALRAERRMLETLRRPDYAMISDDGFPIAPVPERWCNRIDLESAIELFTPIYQLLLTDRDFWRASNSLQLDETMAIYAATIRGDGSALFLLNNQHPLVPLSTLRAGHRLMLHGLAAECLHFQLRLEKRKQLQDSAG